MPAGKKSSGGCENVTFTVHLRIFVLENKIGEFGACVRVIWGMKKGLFEITLALFGTPQ